MKHLILIFVSTLFILSCQKKAEVTTDYQQTSIRWVNGGIGDARVETWKVGPLKRQTLSMGVRIRIDLPRMKDSDIEMLGEKYNVDSWLVTFSKGSLGRRDRLGAFYLPLFRAAGRGRGAGGVAQMESGYIDFFYAAASISARLRSLECPALKHRYKIGNVEVRETANDRSLLVVGPMQEFTYMGKAEKLEFQRNIINGGSTLSGEYEITLAFYNSKTNRVLSNEVVAPQVLVISQEEVENIRGCENAKTPSLEDGDDAIKKFKFGN